MGKSKDDLTRERLEIEEVKGNGSLKQNNGASGKQNQSGSDTTGKWRVLENERENQKDKSHEEGKGSRERRSHSGCAEYTSLYL